MNKLYKTVLLFTIIAIAEMCLNICLCQNANNAEFFITNKKFIYLENSSTLEKEGFAEVVSIKDNIITLSVKGALYSKDISTSNKEQIMSLNLKIHFRNSKYYLQLTRGESEGFMKKDKKSLIFVLDGSSIELIVYE